MGKAHKFNYLSKFKAKVKRPYQELNWLLLAKPVQSNKSHASTPLRAE
jgi:hypothetical protein